MNMTEGVLSAARSPQQPSFRLLRRKPPARSIGVKRSVAVVLFCVLAFPSAANAADPDPDEFTPSGYEFCGWQDFANGGWAMEWNDDLAGAYLVAFTHGMSCPAARRNIRRIRFSKSSGRPIRPGYRCRTLESAHEYLDVRCVKKGGTRKFRYQTGA